MPFMTASRTAFTKIITEGKLDIAFTEEYSPVKFDDTSFYRNKFVKVDGAKGVDVIAVRKNQLLFMEIKDCEGDEPNNRWRIVPNNRKRDTTATAVNTENRDSVDIEVAQKVTMSLACLVGAMRQKDTDYIHNEWNGIPERLDLGRIPEIHIILFLTGDFSTKRMGEKMILSKLQRSIETKLGWLKCRVLVENMSTQKKKYYEARRRL